MGALDHLRLPALTVPGLLQLRQFAKEIRRTQSEIDMTLPRNPVVVDFLGGTPAPFWLALKLGQQKTRHFAAVWGSLGGGVPKIQETSSCSVSKMPPSKVLPTLNQPSFDQRVKD